MARGLRNARVANGNLVTWHHSAGDNFFLRTRILSQKRKFCSHYNILHLNEAPSIQLIKRWMQNFEESGSRIKQPRSGRPRTSRDHENLQHVRPWTHSPDRRHAGDRDVQRISHSAGDNPRIYQLSLSLLVQSKPCCPK